MLYDIFYNMSADAVAKFNDGTTIAFSKAILSFLSKSPIFSQMIYENQSTIEIKDFDRDTFQLFLDCVLDFKQMTFQDAAKIMPVVWKYEVKDWMRRCIIALTPEDSFGGSEYEKACLGLNVAKLCKCEELLDEVSSFLSEKNRFMNVLEDENYLFLLSPDSLIVLIEYENCDSYLLSLLIRWGENYLKIHNKSGSVRELFEELEIMRFISLKLFKTFNELGDFCLSSAGRNFFTPEEIYKHLQDGNLGNEKGQWVKVKANQSFTEKFCFKNIALPKKFKNNMKIKRNDLVFFETPDEFEGDSLTIFKCNVHVEELFMALPESYFEVKYKYPGSVYREKFNLVIESLTDDVTTFNIEVKWIFKYDCRVFKTKGELKSVNVNGEQTDDYLFTKSIRFYHGKK